MSFIHSCERHGVSGIKYMETHVNPVLAGGFEEGKRVVPAGFEGFVEARVHDIGCPAVCVAGELAHVVLYARVNLLELGWTGAEHAHVKVFAV